MNKIYWDIDEAFALWNKGESVRDIAARVGTSENAIYGAAMRHGWPSRERSEPQASIPKVLTKRCPSCWASYQTLRSGTHNCGLPVRSLYEVSGSALGTFAAYNSKRPESLRGAA